MIRVLLFFSLPLFACELSIAALFKNEAPYLKEWIEYHRMVGVDHFWLYNDESTDHWEEILHPYIESGLVEVIEWSTGSPIWYIQFQVHAYRHAIEQAKGKTEWLALIDLDEYLMPTEEETVTECLSKHFSEASAIYVNWRHFGTGGIWLEPGEPLLNRLFSASDPFHPRNAAGKSLIRPHRVTDIWNPHHMVIPAEDTYAYADSSPIPHGWDLHIDGLRHLGFLVLNHYTMRDENYYKDVRVPRANAWGIEPWLTRQLYDFYNATYDFSMLNFLKEKHPVLYKTFWETSKPTVEVDLNAPHLGDRLFQAAYACVTAWEKGAEPYFPSLSLDSADFKQIFFRTPQLLMERSSTPLIPVRPKLETLNHYRDRFLSLFAPHPKDLQEIRKRFYWLDDNPSTVGIYISPEDDPNQVQKFLKRAIPFFPENSTFIVCCKDLAFAITHFPPVRDEVFFTAEENEAILLRILGQCAHLIIDASSLGFWSAWLNSNPDKVVISPNPGDYPADWIHLDYNE